MEPNYDGYDAGLSYANEELMKVKAQRDDLLAACEELLDTIKGLKEDWDVVLRSGDLRRVDQAWEAIAAARPATEPERR